MKQLPLLPLLLNPNSQGFRGQPCGEEALSQVVKWDRPPLSGCILDPLHPGSSRSPASHDLEPVNFAATSDSWLLLCLQTTTVPKSFFYAGYCQARKVPRVNRCPGEQPGSSDHLPPRPLFVSAGPARSCLCGSVWAGHAADHLQWQERSLPLHCGESEAPAAF